MAALTYQSEITRLSVRNKSSVTVFLALAVCKLAQQWLRGSWSQSSKANREGVTTTQHLVLSGE